MAYFVELLATDYERFGSGVMFNHIYQIGFGWKRDKKTSVITRFLCYFLVPLLLSDHFCFLKDE